MNYLYKAGCHSSNILESHLRGFWFACPLNTSCTDIRVLFRSQWDHNHLLPNTLQFIIHQAFCHWSYIISHNTKYKNSLSSIWWLHQRQRKSKQLLLLFITNNVLMESSINNGMFVVVATIDSAYVFNQ